MNDQDTQAAQPGTLSPGTRAKVLGVVLIFLGLTALFVLDRIFYQIPFGSIMRLSPVLALLMFVTGIVLLVVGIRRGRAAALSAAPLSPPDATPAAAPIAPVVPPSEQSNGLAIIAFLLAIFLASFPAVLCAHIALSQIARTGQRGRGLAIAALWIGYIALALFVGLPLIYLVFFYKR